MQNILFRADSSSTIGTGHIMRDLVLASKYKNANIIFATQDLDGNINSKIKEAGYKIELLLSNDVAEFITVVKKYEADSIVIDNYTIDFKYEQRLKEETGVKILAFDDTYERHHCDIVLNHNISADKTKYKGLVPSTCELQCGSKYTLLRDEFYQEYPKKRDTKDINILIAMGGVDSRELNIKILDVLKSFENIRLDVLTTTANKSLSDLKSYAADFDNITLHINSSEVAKLMHKND
ncbi:MAG: UDP-2,4-diacetamido-2,4,6-trideoxy-beta-L-altropyranose hydrolase, partial [Campylobacterota bacterium]|nr:UDP-2,4-diacetamido-2,4,6-trideoxy-beta-L-altropyranose hydrolase [Campylobacterota bacterium]